MMKRILAALVEYFGSMLAIPAVLNRPLREDNGEVAEEHEFSAY